jgi:hypothetical protein
MSLLLNNYETNIQSDGAAPIILLNTPNNILFYLLIATITCDGKFFLAFGLI